MLARESHDECLNQHWFVSLRNDQFHIERWRRSYNTDRPARRPAPPDTRRVCSYVHYTHGPIVCLESENGRRTLTAASPLGEPPARHCLLFASLERPGCFHSMSSQEASDNLVSLFSVGTVLLRRARLITSLGFIGAVSGLLLGLLSQKLFTSNASFVPRDNEGNASGLSALAGQYGVRIPASGAGGATAWSPGVYVVLLTSSSVLEPLALDTVSVSEEGGRVVVVADLFGIEQGPPAIRALRGAIELRKRVAVLEDRRLNMVRLSVTTKWPSVSFIIAQRLLDLVNTYNIKSRQTFAAAERRFIESQTAEAQEELRRTEDQLERFDRTNRSAAGAPSLEFARDRLKRDVTHQQQIFTALRQSLDDARIREHRGLDAIFIIERPLLPAIRDARGSIGKMLLGAVAGTLLGVLIALVAAQISWARRRGSSDAMEFFDVMADLIPTRLHLHRARRRD